MSSIPSAMSHAGGGDVDWVDRGSAWVAKAWGMLMTGFSSEIVEEVWRRRGVHHEIADVGHD